MLITVNGKQENLEIELNILEYIKTKGLNPDAVIVEYNQDILKKEQWQNFVLKENDNLEILRFVGGG